MCLILGREVTLGAPSQVLVSHCATLAPKCSISFGRVGHHVTFFFWNRTLTAPLFLCCNIGFNRYRKEGCLQLSLAGPALSLCSVPRPVAPGQRLPCPRVQYQVARVFFFFCLAPKLEKMAGPWTSPPLPRDEMHLVSESKMCGTDLLGMLFSCNDFQLPRKKK